MVLDTIRTPRIPRGTDSWCPPLQKTQGWGSLKLWSSMEPKRKGGPGPLCFLKGGIPRSCRARDFLLTPAGPSFIESTDWRFESRISPPFQGGLYGTDNSGRHRTSCFDVINPVGRSSDRLWYGGDWFAISCRCGGQRCHFMCYLLSRRGSCHARLSFSSR